MPTGKKLLGKIAFLSKYVTGDHTESPLLANVFKVYFIVISYNERGEITWHRQLM